MQHQPERLASLRWFCLEVYSQLEGDGSLAHPSRSNRVFRSPQAMTTLRTPADSSLRLHHYSQADSLQHCSLCESAHRWR
jgi:hypothetical protein